MWDLIVLIHDDCHSKEGPLYVYPWYKSIGVHTLSFPLFRKILFAYFLCFFKFLTFE